MPIHFALVNNGQPIGHIKLTRVLGDEGAYYAESVIVSKKLRGAGLGTIIMRLAERFIAEHLAPKGTKPRLVLSTLDSAAFYAKIGYKPCFPEAKTKHLVSY